MFVGDPCDKNYLSMNIVSKCIFLDASDRYSYIVKTLSIDHKSTVMHVMLKIDSCRCVRCVAKVRELSCKETCMIVHYIRNIGHASTS